MLSASILRATIYPSGSVKREKRKMAVSEKMEDKIFHIIWSTDYMQ